MFMSMLTCHFYNHLIESSPADFTELILTGERVENGIKSGIIHVATSLNTVKKSYNGKKESNIVYGQKGHDKSGSNQSIGAALISNFAPVQQQQNNQRRQDTSKR